MRHGYRALVRGGITSSLSFSVFVFVFVSLFLTIPDSVCHAASPYINKVYAFRPAPGQFVNIMPTYEAGDTEETMRQKAEDAIAGENQVIISLGAWGGYIVFGFDHAVGNSKGQKDIRILGNSGKNGAEPGVIYVSYDANNNGLPDDKWYEIAGSEFGNKSTFRDYRMTYHRTPAVHEQKPDKQECQADTTYIKWEDNKGKSGYLFQNIYHTQDYFPMWLNDDELVYSGTLLPNNAIATPQEGKPTLYTLPALAFGYADNAPSSDADGESIDIDWAVDETGEYVHLSAIHFVKVQCGLNQQCGWIGETSTEIKGAVDLHPDMITALPAWEQSESDNTKIMRNGQILICRPDGVYNLFGTRIQ